MGVIYVTDQCPKPRLQVLGSYIPMTTTNQTSAGQVCFTKNNSIYVIQSISPSAAGAHGITVTENCPIPRANVFGSYIPLSQVAATSAQRTYIKTNNQTYLVETYTTQSQSASASVTYLTSQVDSAGLTATTALTRSSTSATQYLTRSSTSSVASGYKTVTTGTTYLTRVSTSGTNYGTKAVTEVTNRQTEMVMGNQRTLYIIGTATKTNTMLYAAATSYTASGTFTCWDGGESVEATAVAFFSGTYNQQYNLGTGYVTLSQVFQTTGTTYLTRVSTSGTNYGTSNSLTGTTALTRASTSATSYLTRSSTSGYSGQSSSSSSSSQSKGGWS